MSRFADIMAKSGYILLLVYLVAALLASGLAVCFVTLAGWLAYSEITAAGQVRLKFLMMPIMNVLISSILFYYGASFFGRVRGVGRAVRQGTFTMPPVRVTRYDVIGLIGFLLFAAALTYMIFYR